MKKRGLLIGIPVLIVLVILALLLLKRCGRKVADIQPPSVPAGLSVQAASPYEMKLLWLPSTDDTGVVEYRVYQGQALLEAVSQTSSFYAGLTPGSAYCYTLTALDAAGNESGKSPEVCSSTPDIAPVVIAKAPPAKRPPAPPAPPTGLKARPVATTQIDLSWNASTAELGILGYNVYIEGKLHKTVPVTTAASTGLRPDTSYCYTVTAVDTARVESRPTPVVCARTLVEVAKKPLSPPVGLKADAVSTTQINLAWSPPKEDWEKVAGYNVYMRGALLKAEKLNSSVHARLSPNTEYCYTVTAFDASGKESPPSEEACARTPVAADTVSPTTPTGLTAVAMSPTEVDLKWAASRDNVGVTGYKVYKDGAYMQDVQATAMTHKGISGEAVICYRVSAFDAAGNESGQSQQVCVTMKATGEKGTVWVGGNNDYGQLGDGTTMSKEALVRVPGLTNISRITAGMNHTVALKFDGTVWAWGQNAKGQLGDGTNADRHNPVQVKGLSDVADIAAGWYHTVALKKDGSVWTWGRNYYGQLGDGSTRDRYVPMPVRGFTDVVAITAGWYHTVAVKKDGSVWAWGWNLKGQLGDGTTDDSYKPVRVRDLEGIVTVAAGQHHTVALKKDGTVWAWGWNKDGQIGSGPGAAADRYMPTQAVGLTNISAIAAGGNHTVALRKDGTVWTWGNNDFGQIGDGTTAAKNSPVKVEGFTDIAAIAAGMNYTVAIKSDGTLWAWGWSIKGKTPEKFVPIRLGGIVGVSDLAAGMYHVAALKE